MKLSNTYLSLAALSVAVCGQPVIAQSSGDFGTGAWTDTSFLKTYADRQCVISEEAFSSTGDLTTMDARITCGPLSGNLRVHYAFNLVRVSCSFEVESSEGTTTIFSSSRWQRSGDGC